MSKALPDMSRTEAAIVAYDGQGYDPYDTPLAIAVGVAFGLDTADRNDPETCKACIRPGKPLAADHPDLSFVRRLVRDWRAQG